MNFILNNIFFHGNFNKFIIFTWCLHIKTNFSLLWKQKWKKGQFFLCEIKYIKNCHDHMKREYVTVKKTVIEMIRLTSFIIFFCEIYFLKKETEIWSNFPFRLFFCPNAKNDSLRRGDHPAVAHSVPEPRCRKYADNFGRCSLNRYLSICSLKISLSICLTDYCLTLIMHHPATRLSAYLKISPTPPETQKKIF